jgi:hypothetical protein
VPTSEPTRPRAKKMKPRRASHLRVGTRTNLRRKAPDGSFEQRPKDATDEQVATNELQPKADHGEVVPVDGHAEDFHGAECSGGGRTCLLLPRPATLLPPHRVLDVEGCVLTRCTVETNSSPRLHHSSPSDPGPCRRVIVPDDGAYAR